MQLLLGRRLNCFCFAVILVFSSISVQAYSNISVAEKPLRIAVASNFAPTLKRLLVQANKQRTFAEPIIVAASSGTLYLQIQHGATFDIFLSADAKRPQLLTDAELTLAESQQTYALGQLALWTAQSSSDLSSKNLLYTLNENSQRLAIANPNIAPYGKAAKEVLTSLQLWHNYQNRLIQGINIGQTFQQVRSQAVSLGIVSNSQLVLNNFKGVLIPQRLHQPIEQQLVILKNSENIAQAQRFVNFLLSVQCQQFIVESGYANLKAVQADE